MKPTKDMLIAMATLSLSAGCAGDAAVESAEEETTTGGEADASCAAEGSCGGEAGHAHSDESSCAAEGSCGGDADHAHDNNATDGEASCGEGSCG